MYARLSLVLVAALAAVAQADDQHQSPEYLHKNGTYSMPAPSGTGAPLPSGLAPPSSAVGPSQVPSSAPIPMSTGALSTAVPLSTGVPMGTGAAGSGSSPSSAGQVEDSTLTYTVGAGPSASVIVTTIRHTVFQTDSSTVYATSGPADAATSAGRRTSYRTIQSTIYVPEATGAASGAKSAATGGAAGSGNANSAAGCGATVTVTEVGPAVTVTVTADSGSDSGSSPTSAGSIDTSPQSAAPIDIPPQSSAAGEAGASAVPPYPSSVAGNSGAQSMRYKTTCKSTGFITKPSASFTLHPTGTGNIPFVGATATAPAFRRRYLF